MLGRVTWLAPRPRDAAVDRPRTNGIVCDDVPRAAGRRAIALSSEESPP